MAAPRSGLAPATPKIYHITHVDNLPQIISHGVVWSDAERIKRGLDCTIVGLGSIKRRRLAVLAVTCHPGTRVGEYVPFYFCPRSVMLYILHMANHPELSYRGGQGPIVHLVADLQRTIGWAESEGRPWAFSDRNAGAGYANFYGSLDALGRLDWAAIRARDWRAPAIKEGKQAEFLVYESFPWVRVERIGVHNETVAQRVRQIVADAEHRPPVAVRPDWYY
jgi:hypothetical protein